MDKAAETAGEEGDNPSATPDFNKNTSSRTSAETSSVSSSKPVLRHNLAIAQSLVSPRSFLFTTRPKPPSLPLTKSTHVRTIPEEKMDKRHPSSFQQLEKVCIEV